MVEAEEGIIGTGSLVFLEDGVYEIAKMAVTDKCQARGIGDALMQALFARARELGATKLFIVSNTKLERAIRLYRKYGFYEIDVEPHRDSYERCDIALECLLTQDNTIKEALV